MIKRKTGSSLVEVTMGMAVLIPVVLSLLDLSFVVAAVEANDLTCRNAARAAASGDPTTAAARAQLVVCPPDGRDDKESIVCNSVIATPVAVNVISQPAPQLDSTSGKEFNPGGPIAGTVTVTTDIIISPFFLHHLFSRDRKLCFRSEHSCPITYVVAASSPAANSAPDRYLIQGSN